MLVCYCVRMHVSVYKRSSHWLAAAAALPTDAHRRTLYSSMSPHTSSPPHKGDGPGEAAAGAHSVLYSSIHPSMPPHTCTPPHKKGDGPGEEDAARVGGRAGHPARGGDFGVRGTCGCMYIHTRPGSTTLISPTGRSIDHKPHTPPNHPHRTQSSNHTIKYSWCSPPHPRCGSRPCGSWRPRWRWPRAWTRTSSTRGVRKRGFVLVVYPWMYMSCACVCRGRVRGMYTTDFSNRRPRNPNTSPHNDDDDNRGGRAVAARRVRGQDREVAGAAQG